MIFKISWRNIWRSPTRSFVVIGAIIVGVWSIIILMSMITGMIESYIKNTITNEISHIQIHHKDFPKDKESIYFMKEGTRLLSDCEAINGIENATLRSMSNAMISSSKSTKGIRVSGVIPEREKLVTGISLKITEGEYFKSKTRNPILVSSVTANKMKLKLRTKVVLTFQNLQGDITAAAFRVVGIFDTGNTIYDEFVVFVRHDDLNLLLGHNDIGHELAMILNDVNDLEMVQSSLVEKYPNLWVQNYKEIAPELELFQANIKMGSFIYMAIFMLALIFGIINTMLMTVLERYKELAMLMAVGMNKGKVFLMIVFETLLLAAISVPVGILVSYLTILHFSKTGIDLFFYSEEGMKQFGMSKFIYPSVDTSLYGELALAVAITALLASLYPAYKAIQLKPIEGLRKI